MKTILRLCLAIFVAGGCASCTLTETYDTEVITCPQQDESVTVAPWDTPDDTGNENIGN